MVPVLDLHPFQIVYDRQFKTKRIIKPSKVQI